jgi:hypothetical protein
VWRSDTVRRWLVGGDQDAERAYDETRDPAWAEAVDQWVWKPRDEDSRIKSGPCQRCGHKMTVLDEVVILDMAIAYDGESDGALRKYAACTCKSKHPETPEGKSGCGANGLIARA